MSAETEGVQWWRNPARPDTVSTMLLREKRDMLRFFDTDSPREVLLPPSSWDKEKFMLETHNANLHAPHDHILSPGRGTTEYKEDFDIAWNINFSMLESEHLCEPEKAWDMWFIYGKKFPEGRQPVITYTNHDYYAPLSTVSRGRGWSEDGNKEYIFACYTDKAGNDLPHYRVAFQGLLWLRANLHAGIHKLATMLDYSPESNRQY